MKEFISKTLLEKELLGKIDKVDCISLIYGGSINDSYLVELDGQKYFVKSNSRADISNFFNAERKGLELLSSSKGVSVPAVITMYSEGDSGMLVLEYIEAGRETSDSWQRFGSELAELHSNSTEAFGLEEDNFIGSLPQPNKQYDSWVEFFISQRLEKQYEMASNSRLLDSSFRKMLDQLYGRLEDIIPSEKPALLHGDLWSGNFKFNSKGVPYIFDPAVYFGHREVDLAMMHLFGGFDKQIFQSYNEVFPLETGWEERIDLFNLYPLFVHVNLFGGSYIPRLEQVLRKYL